MWYLLPMIQGECQKCQDQGETHGVECIVRKLILERDFPRALPKVSRKKALEAALEAIEKHMQKQKEKPNNMTQLQTQNQNMSLEERFGYTPEQMQYIRNKVCKYADDAELTQFFYRCSVLKLDPLMPGQIYFFKFKKRNPKPGEDEYSPGTIVVGVDGFRSLAQRTGLLSGIRRGVIRNAKGECTGGWADVYRKGWDQPAHLEVSLKEYADPWKDAWKNMPESMIQKVAEVAALRMAFPEALGGIYSHEEMDQARRQEREVESSVQTTPAKRSALLEKGLSVPIETPKISENTEILEPGSDTDEDYRVCCGKPMIVSKFPDKNFGMEHPLYCLTCKAKKYQTPPARQETPAQQSEIELSPNDFENYQFVK